MYAYAILGCRDTVLSLHRRDRLCRAPSESEEARARDRNRRMRRICRAVCLVYGTHVSPCRCRKPSMIHDRGAIPSTARRSALDSREQTRDSDSHSLSVARTQSLTPCPIPPRENGRVLFSAAGGYDRRYGYTCCRSGRREGRTRQYRTENGQRDTGGKTRWRRREGSPPHRTSDSRPSIPWHRSRKQAYGRTGRRNPAGQQ